MYVALAVSLLKTALTQSCRQVRLLGSHLSARPREDPLEPLRSLFVLGKCLKLHVGFSWQAVCSKAGFGKHRLLHNKHALNVLSSPDEQVPLANLCPVCRQKSLPMTS